MLAGPVDAAFKAVDSLVKVEMRLMDYSVSSVTEGIEALATTRVLICPVEQTLSDHAALGKIQRTFSGRLCDVFVLLISMPYICILAMSCLSVDSNL